MQVEHLKIRFLYVICTSAALTRGSLKSLNLQLICNKYFDLVSSD